MSEPWELEWELVERCAGTGGQGLVSRVRHRKNRAEGALKQLHPQYASVKERRYRVQVETTALTMLEGEGTPRVLQSNAENWQKIEVPLFLVTEWIDGPTLAREVLGHPRSIDEAFSLMRPLLAMLGRLAALDIGHRDIKPDNIILRAGSLSQPVLIDFGMSWIKPAETEDEDFHTASNQEVGNRFLRLPEHAPGGVHRHSASDTTFAVGILFFLLSGRYPRQLADEDGILPHARQSVIPDSTLIDRRWSRLERVFRTGFAHQIARRYQTAEALSSALSHVDAPPNDVTAGTDAELVDLVEELRNFEPEDAATMRRVMEDSVNLFVTAIHAGLTKVPAQVASSLVQEPSNPMGLVHRITVSCGSFPTTTVIDHAVFARPASGTFEARYQVMKGSQKLAEYYKGSLADPESLREASEQAGKAAAADAVRSLLSQSRG